MRYALIAVLFSVRPVDSIAADTLKLAVERSTAVRSLIETLERSDVVIHIESSQELPAGIGGTTRFVITRGGYRYVRIAINARLPKQARAAILGHELRHACEIAESHARDIDSVRRLFERSARRSGEFFETRAALDTERHVRRELKGPRPLQAEPVIKFDH